MDAGREGGMLCRTLQTLCEPWDGRKAILEMKTGGCRNWRQMEWFGWYFEWRGKLGLIKAHGGSNGPRYGKSAIDYVREHPWDLKAHAMTKRRGFTSLNDAEAVDSAIAEFGGVGFLIVCGIPTPDEDRSFRKWHVRLAGGESEYSKRRRLERAPSRKRKSAFDAKEIIGFYLTGEGEVHRGLAEGWLTRKDQVGRRNSNDTIRRAKYGVIVEEIPLWARV